MDKTQALQNLLNGTATEQEINLLKGGLASGEISIGGNVNQSVIIIGSGNTVELPPAALDRLGGRSLLGDLDRDLTGDEIAAGLNRLESELPLRAPILLTQFQEQVRRLRSILKTNPKSLSDHARKERVEALAQVNSLCMEALDISFNALCLGEEPPEYDARSPFRGLESFRPEDSEFFFGREALTKKLVDKINSHPFLAILGASGSGKSSLVMAGLILALSSEYIIFRPGTNPLEALDTVKENILFVVDQFEELFTLTRDEATRKEFVTKLLETTKKNRVVITLRSDFLGEVGAYRSLKEEIQSHLEIVPPMDMDELRRAIEGQANQAGLRFEADLSQQILDDVEGEPGAMPLLQHALWELWNRRHGCALRASEYRAFGGVKQAITSTAEKVYGECTKAEQEQIRDIFLRLTRLDNSDEGRDTRRRVSTNDLILSRRDTASVTMLLDKLANVRLIVKTVNEDKTEIEVAHEALIRHWERLRLWLNEDRDNLRLRDSVSEDAKKWENAGRDESLLNHRGARLELVLATAKLDKYKLNPIEQAYLQACVDGKEREKSAQESIRRKIWVGLVGGIILAMLLAGFSVYQMKQAQRQTNIARARELASHSISQSEKNIGSSWLLSVEAFRKADTIQTRGLLLSTVQANPRLLQYLVGGTSANWSVAFSPDGRTVASGSWDNTILLWDVNTQKRIGQLKGHKDSVWSVAFSPDGKILASGSADGTIILWNMKSFEPIRLSLKGYTGDASSIIFSPDGKTLASGNGDAIILWNVTTHQPVGQPLKGHTLSVESVAFSPNGKILASSDGDGNIILWNTTTQQPLGQKLTYSNSSITSVAFSPDGKTLASGSFDNTAVLWDVATRRPIGQPLDKHTAPILSLAFSPDGKTLATGSEDHTILLWDVSSHSLIDEPLKSNDWVSSLAFSPDGKILVSGSLNNTAGLWNVSTLQSPINELKLLSKQNVYTSAAFSPDEKIFATGEDSGIIKLWDLKTYRFIKSLQNEKDGFVRSISFSSNGRMIAAGTDHNNVTLWDITTYKPIFTLPTKNLNFSPNVVFDPDGKTLAVTSESNTIGLFDTRTLKFNVQPLKGHDAPILSMSFSSDGKLLASGSSDRTIILWDLSTHEPIGQPIDVYDYVRTVVFSPDGKIFASGGDNEEINLWDVASHKPIAPPLIGAADMVGGVVLGFSPDGKLIASGYSNDTIVLWDVQSYLPIAQLLNEDSENNANIINLKFIAGGEKLISVNSDGRVVNWDLSPQSWVEKICQRVGRNFTLAEWAIYFPDEEYRVTCPQWPRN